MGLDLYSQIEEYLDFDEEVNTLHNTFLDIVKELKPKSVLDVGCGQGDFLQLLAQENISALGIDLSAKQIEACNLKGLEAKHIELKDINQKFDALTAIFDVLNYIPNSDIKEFLIQAKNALNDGGYFIFDVNTLFGFEEVAQGSLNIDVDEKFISIDANFEDEEKSLKTDITLFSKNENQSSLYEKKSSSIKQYFHSDEFLKKTLKESGFELEGLIEFNLHSDEENDKLIYICKSI